MNREISRLMEWLRMSADLIFIIVGVAPVVIASLKAYRIVRQRSSRTGSKATLHAMIKE